MIVFFGYGDDRALELAVAAAAELGVEHLVMDQRRPDLLDMELESGPSGEEGWIRVGDATVRLSAVCAAYARPLTPIATADAAANARGRTVCELMLDWLDVATVRVVSRPSAMSSNASKPFQAQEIAAAGLSVPDTIVTSDPERAQEFRRRHGQVVFKSTSGIRSIVRRLDRRAEARLGRLAALPVQFQELVPGTDVRVHVVGRKTFATEVRSSAVDYRYARRDGLAAELAAVDIPAELRRRCVDVADRLGLPFCGIDLRRRPDGAYVCFEANPMPGYSYYELETGQPISGALVRYLAGCEDG